MGTEFAKHLFKQRIYMLWMLGCILSILLVAHSAHATQSSLWLGGRPITAEMSALTSTISDDEGLAGCNNETARIATNANLIETKNVCAVYGKNIVVAAYTLTNGYKGYAVKYNGDIIYHIIQSITSYNQRLQFYPENDRLITYDGAPRQYRDILQPYIAVYANLAASLKPIDYNGSGLVGAYALDDTKRLGLFKDPTSQKTYYPNVVDYVVSGNGRYVVANISYQGYVLANVQSGGATKVISAQAGSAYGGMYNPRVAAVSNDGRYVYVEGMWNIYDTQGCGDEVSQVFLERSNRAYNMMNPCDFRNVYAEIMQGKNYLFYGSSHLFEDDNKTLSFNIEHVYGNDAIERKHIALHAPSYVATPQLDYLALGDSYSSGEGDIDKKSDGSSYYMLGTKDKGQCHLSARSYPFLLSSAYGISPNKMHSVACSGAQVMLDYIAQPDSYRGQGGRLSGVDEISRKTAQQAALDNYSPGLTPQLEFVKKYQPKVVTLTGGGNDVGFADILAYCATPSWEGLLVDDTCGYAIHDSPLEKMLYDSIDTQYNYTRFLLKRIREYSPESRVILVGYPSFVKEGSLLPCAFNGGSLNGRERDMINEGVHYMNRMLQKAANDSGVSYVDVEDSLKGGRICEGSSYVNGLYSLGLDNIIHGNTDESFHPNAKGHTQIASAIRTSGQFATPTPASTNDYAPDVGSVTTLPHLLVPGSRILKTAPTFTLSTNPHSLQGNSSAKVTLYSQSIDIGTVTTQADGSLDTLFSTKDLPLGRHVITVIGTSFSGEPVTYYQFIQVRSAPEESDGDGITDTQVDTTEKATASTLAADANNKLAKPAQPGHNIVVYKNKSESSSKTSKDSDSKGSVLGAIAEHIPENKLPFWGIFVILIAAVSGGIYGIKKRK